MAWDLLRSFLAAQLLLPDATRVELDLGPRCSPFAAPGWSICDGSTSPPVKLEPGTLGRDACASSCGRATQGLGALCCVHTPEGACLAQAGAMPVPRKSGFEDLNAVASCVPADDTDVLQAPDLSSRNAFLLKPTDRGMDQNAESVWQLPSTAGFIDRVLFRRIMPYSLRQGGTGDCWLVAAIASLARFPLAIRHLFHQQDANAEGQYELQLYDIAEHAWVRIHVDDTVPISNNEAHNIKVTHLDEIWPVLLEKAVVKLVNREKREEAFNYMALNLGYGAWAFTALTGSEQVKIYLQMEAAGIRTREHAPHKNRWAEYELDVEKTVSSIDRGIARPHETNGTGLTFHKQELWQKLNEAEEKHWPATGFIASTQRQGEEPRADGLFGGHAYSILGVAEIFPDSHHSVCMEIVTVFYRTGDEMELQRDLKRIESDSSPWQQWTGKPFAESKAVFRGWGEGDVVWSHYRAVGKGKSHSLRKIRVVSVRENCSDEGPCVFYVKVDEGENPSWAKAREMFDRTAKQVKFLKEPLSWVVKPAHWGWAEQHGVRKGYRLVDFCHGNCSQHLGYVVHESFNVLTFQGVTDPSTCASPGHRAVQRTSLPITSLQASLKLVKVRNPWGSHLQYTGKWSDADVDSWSKHADIAQALAFNPGPDGATWMLFCDFSNIFTRVTVSEQSLVDFDPPPPECNTDWGSTTWKPFEKARDKRGQLSWPAGAQPASNECAWCIVKSLQVHCSSVWAPPILGYRVFQSDGSQLCCKVAATHPTW
eukprot:TRINITY_DN106277_c0_g1_i1.p1 TRINITY_DN106277_c0_g1~~TRINITY_DN106277_c0_g1_i1.p1  ORF type:complete len:765 (+),score=120.94 TRINITY_DN106277_c0_g1_i1:51-2345(+)